MRVLHERVAGGNFGDDLNQCLWPALVPDLLDDDPDVLLLGIGTIVRNWDVPGARHVFGAGAGYAPLDARDAAPGRWRFHCVRGPLTARALGLDRRVAITDPALLVRRLPRPRGAKRWAAAFMPHHASAPHADWGAIAGAAGLAYIDPRAGPFRALQAIAASELLVTEAMHGAIVADALRVPWIPVKLYPWILDFKWRDWSATVDIAHTFEAPLAPWPPWRPEGPRAARPTIVGVARELARGVKRALAERFLAQAARARPRLSRDGVVAGLEARLLEALERMRREVRGAARPELGPASWAR